MVMESWLASERGAYHSDQNTVTIQSSQPEICNTRNWPLFGSLTLNAKHFRLGEQALF